VIPAAPLDREGIRAIIPHREPFLLLDEVTELEPGVRARGRYLVKPDDWYLAGHFPGNPIMPGVLQVEALAQLGRCAASPIPISPASSRCLPASTTSASSASSARVTSSTWSVRSTAARPDRKGRCDGAVGGELACRATLTFALTTIEAPA